MHFGSKCIIGACLWLVAVSATAQGNKTVEEIRKYLDVDSLAFQSIDGLLEATGSARDHFCLACFTTNYPTPTPRDYDPGVVRQRLVDTSTYTYEMSGFPTES